jgi:hypothetical protein
VAIGLITQKGKF